MVNIQAISQVNRYVKQICKNNVQALKYPSAYAVTLYIPGFKAIN